MKKFIYTILLLTCTLPLQAQNTGDSSLLLYKKLRFLSTHNLANNAVHINDAVTQAAKQFIQDEFGVTFKAGSVLYTSVGDGCDSCAVQYSLLSFVFGQASQLQALKKAVSKMHTINFQITILNVYKVFYTKNEALFIYTYRPMNNEIMELVVNNKGLGSGK